MRKQLRKKKTVQRSSASDTGNLGTGMFKDLRPETQEQLQLKQALQTQTVNGQGVVQRVMWYMSSDHKNRILNLAALNPKKDLPNGHVAGFFGSSYLQDDGDTSITLWGHTDEEADEFGDLSSDHLVDALLDLGIAESQHTVLNILSCAPHTKFNAHMETYAQRVQQLLDLQLPRKVQVKTLPYAPEGMDSRLVASNIRDEMYYVIFPSDALQDFEAIHHQDMDFDIEIERYKKLGFTVLPSKYSSILDKFMLPVKT